MNANQLINMALRVLMRRGVSKGIDHFSRKGRDPKDMTTQEREAARARRGQMQSGRRSVNWLRRFTRF